MAGRGTTALRPVALFEALANASAPAWLAALLIVCSVVFGGGTRAGFLSDVILQALAIPALLFGLRRQLAERAGHGSENGAGTTLLLILCAAALLIPMVQLLPLPPGAWASLPGHSLAAQAQSPLSAGPGWKPLAVAPNATWYSLLSILPALAIVINVLQTTYRERRALCLLFVALCLVSVILGLLQVAQGPTSPLRFFDFTNPTEAVGFFANRNHYAALMYVGLLLAIPWTAVAVRELGEGLSAKRLSTPALIATMVCFTAVVLLISAQFMARSRAGLGLTIAGLFGALALSASAARRETGARLGPARLLVGAVVVAVLFASQFALYRVLERFEADPLADARIPFARNTIEAAKSYMPLGAGFGGFVPVYATFEKPADALSVFANRAHNDYLEFWLEAGVPGMLAAGFFFAWLAVRMFAVWRGRLASARRFDVLIARAATLAIVLLLLHSVVDYPLRTGALMAVFAFACGLLVAPVRTDLSPAGAADQDERLFDQAGVGSRRRKHRSRSTPRVDPHATPLQDGPRRPAEAKPWVSDRQWPDAWQGTATSERGEEEEMRPVPDGTTRTSGE